MTVTLRDITPENWEHCIRLKVRDDQMNFVSNNTYSLVQAHYEPQSKLVPLGIYDDETMVGFIMYGEEDYGLSKIWFIMRLMVDKAHQGKGYGRAAMQQAIERMKPIPGFSAILISFVPENEAARKLYASLGFLDTGEVEDGELVYRLAL